MILYGVSGVYLAFMLDLLQFVARDSNSGGMCVVLIVSVLAFIYKNASILNLKFSKLLEFTVKSSECIYNAVSKWWRKLPTFRRKLLPPSLNVAEGGIKFAGV